jgi:hypothetical protein
MINLAASRFLFFLIGYAAVKPLIIFFLPLPNRHGNLTPVPAINEMISKPSACKPPQPSPRTFDREKGNIPKVPF